MKKFRFTLEAVQTVRESAAAKALETYARAVRAQSDAEAALAAANLALTQHLEAWRKAMAKGFGAAEMLSMGHTRTLLEHKRNQCAEALRNAGAAVIKALAEYHLARQKSDVVERFHERKRHEFNLALVKEEQHFLDELATTRRAAAYA